MTTVTNARNPLSLRNGANALDLPSGESAVDSTLLDNVLASAVNARLYEAQCFPKRSGLPATVDVSNGSNALCLNGGDFTIDLPHGTSTHRVDQLQAVLAVAINASLYDASCQPDSSTVLALSPTVA